LWAHELSHHWWGDLATCTTAEDMWLNEGWASYSEQERTIGNFYTPDYPLFYALLNKTLELKDKKGYKKLLFKTFY
jgi:aminopeptidase N